MDPSKPEERPQPRSLLERQRYLFKNVGTKLKSDVQFHFENEAVTLYAIKNILSSASNIFETMFYGPLTANGNQFNSESVKIDDISSDTFRELLRFIYLDEVFLYNYNVCQVIYAAHKYEITSLENKCVQYMGDNLNATSAVIYYRHTNLLETINSSFLSSVLRFIDQNMEEICTLHVLFDLDANLFISLTKRDTMYVSEYTLYNVAMEWSRRACENQSIQPTVLNRTNIFQGFKSIRFPLMTSWEFDQCSFSLLAFDIMTAEEMQKIEKYIDVETEGCELDFSTKKRGERTIMMETEVRKRFSNVERKIGFYVLRHTKVISITTTDNCEIAIVQQMANAAYAKAILHRDKKCSFVHKFLMPTILKPNETYELEMTHISRVQSDKNYHMLKNIEPFVFQSSSRVQPDKAYYMLENTEPFVFQSSNDNPIKSITFI